MKNVLKSSEEAAAERDRLELRLEDHWEEATDQFSTRSNGKGKSRENSRPDSTTSSNSASILSSTSMNRHTGWTTIDDEERKERALLAKMELAMETGNLDVDLSLLGLGDGKTMGGIDEADEEGIENPFIWDRCQPDQMIVFSLEELPVIFDTIISDMKPVATKSQRVIPANVIFLCARYAHYHSNLELLEELFLGAIERIEVTIHVSIFWLYVITADCFV